MDFQSYLIILCSIIFPQILTQVQERKTYRAAVIEYTPYFKKGESAENIINNNVNQYIEFIKEASQKNVDIIVFPECGLTTLHLPASRDQLQQFATHIPSPTDYIVLCNTENTTGNSKAIKKLSCAAAEYNIYIAVNLVESHDCVQTDNCSSDGVLIYNTNVVFDRKGAVIARYRKFNLFNEPGFNVTKTTDLTTFTTDFGVTFGMFICFDILFEEPALKLVREMDIHDFVYSTAWFSQMPFLTAAETQAGWAYSHDVTLLASGYNNINLGNGGSGIYEGRSFKKAYMPRNSGSKVIIADISKTNLKKNILEPQNIPNIEQEGKSDFNMFKDNLTNYSTELLNFTTNPVIEKTICNNELCCQFKVVADSPISNDYIYRLTVFDGIRPYGLSMHAGIQVCGLIACLNDNIHSCGNLNPAASIKGQKFKAISINGEFRKNKFTFQFPVTLTYNILPLENYNYYFDNTITESILNIGMNVNDVENLLTFGVYGRDTSLDKWHHVLESIDNNIVVTESENMLVLQV